MDKTSTSAKIDILEKKLQRSEELLESARGMSDQRAVKLVTIRHHLQALNTLLRARGIGDSEIMKAVTELNEAAR